MFHHRAGACLEVTVADSGTASAAFPTSEFALALAIRARTGVEDTGDLTFTGSNELAGTYSAVTDDAGNAITVALAADKWVGVLEAEARILLAIPYLKLVAGSQTGIGTYDVAMK